MCEKSLGIVAVETIEGVRKISASIPSAVATRIISSTVPFIDTSKSIEVINCLSCDSRAEVEDLVRNAVAAGGTTYAEPKDYGFMYQHSFADPDGHCWELVHMSAMPSA